MFDPQLAANNEWSYQKIFGDGDFIAAGQLTIPVAGRKPSKSSKDNTYASSSSHLRMARTNDVRCRYSTLLKVPSTSKFMIQVSCWLPEQ
jgi:hypothetical protein